MNSKLKKELFIYALLLIVIIFTMSLLFYDCIPQKKEKIESFDYLQESEVADVLNEINANSDGTSNNREDSLLKSYSIGKEELTAFATENYYESGKKDPFAEYSSPVEEEIIKQPVVNKQENNKTPELKETVTNTVSNSISENNLNSKQEQVQNTTKEEVKETTTGKYFENKSSK